MSITRLLLVLPLVGAAPLGDLIASRLRALQSLHGLKVNETVAQGTAQKSRFYPEFGPPLTMREVIAKETFRLVAQMALERMPSRRHDDSYEMYYPQKKKKSYLQSRQFFESEEFLLFLIGLGLASVLSMATMMAPLNQLAYSNAYGAVAPAGIQAVPVAPGLLTVPQGRRKRSLAQSRQIEEAHARFRSASQRFGRLRVLTTSRIE